MNHKKNISIFIMFIMYSAVEGQQIDRILPYNNFDTTGVYIIFDGNLKYDKEILQSPPSLSLIFPNANLTEGNHQKMVDMPPLYRIEAKETLSNKYYKHVKVDLFFSEIPEFRIDHIGENIIRIIWSTEKFGDEYKTLQPGDQNANLEIWSNFENQVTMNLKMQS